MDTYPLLKGIIIGFSIALPVGPISILCIRRTLSNGQLSGIASGLGAATADGFYGIIAAFGVTFISNILVGQQFWFRLVGGLFLLYLGVQTWLAKPAEKPSMTKPGTLIGDYGSTLFLTLMNPMTIIAYAAIFAGLSPGESSSQTSAIIMVLGIILGSILWSCVILSGGVSLLRAKINAHHLKVINRISALIIILFAIIAFTGL
jgi:threonine/homoserine/homoserine lactone efflux protein